MTQLYIANATKQVIEFAYWPIERGRMTLPFVQSIPSGVQVRIACRGSNTDLSIEEIDFIVGQHLKYGLIKADEIDSNQYFYGMCYSVGDPVPPDRLQRAIKHNDDRLEEHGRQTRKEAAIAVNGQITRIGEDFNKLEMSVKEIEPRGGHHGDHDPVREKIMLDPRREEMIVTDEVSNA